MRALWDNIRFNKPKNKYSLEHLKYLYSIISKNPIINEQNKVIIIETLRQIAELLIWGDQHNSMFFDYFLEKNLLAYFLNILDQKTSKNVKVQLLQTLSILIENIRAQNSLYYLFSNNHVNELIIHRFDFSDEEVLAYYISLLKTLSLKLDRSTIQFFFNAQENDFPLYTEAIKFFNHEEGMIRIAVRTLTLNVYRVEDELMRRYILNSTAVPYFSNIVWFIRQQCYTLDQMVRTTSHDNRRKLDDFVAEMLDHFYYLHDIFCLGIESMSLVLSEQLLHYLLTPLLVESLGEAATSKEDKKEDQGDDEKISPVLALFLLAQVFSVFTHKPLINTLAAALIHPDPSTFSILKQQCPVGPPPPLSDLAPKRTHYVSFRRFSSVPNLEVLESVSLKGTQSAPPSPVPPVTHDSSAITIKSPRSTSFSESNDSKLTSPSPSKSSPSLLSLDELSRASPASATTEIPTIEVEDYSQKESPTKASPIQTPRQEETSEKGRNIHRDALLGFFEDDRTALNALCMLIALIKNEAVERDLLEAGGLFPYRLTKAKYLLDILTNNSTAKPLQVPSVSHLKEEQHHARSKSDSHAVAIAITDLNLRRKALVNNTSNDSTTTPANNEGSDSETTATNTSITDDSDANPAELSEGNSVGPVHRSHRSAIHPKKPLPPLPSGRADESPAKHSSSHQNPFTHALIGRLLSLLVKSNTYRLVTLQLTLIMLKELVCSPDSPPGLTPRQLAMFEKAYRVVSDKFEQRLSVEIFLELFDVEVKNYKPPNFENLIKDAALLLPVSGTSKSRLDLARRLPSSETEITQQAIQQYLVLRELKYTILHKKDDVLPHLKQHIPTISVSPKDQYTIDSTAECIVIPFATVIQGSSVLKKRLKRLLIVNKETLIVLDPTTSLSKPATPPPEEVKPQQGGHNAVSGTVVHAAPLQSINLEIDRNDPLSLQVTSHPTTWSMPMVFEDEKKCQAAYDLLMTARNELRDARIHKIRTLLATSEDKTYINANNSSPIGTKHEPADSQAIPEDGIDSIIYTVEKLNKSAKISPDLKHQQPTSPEDNNFTSTGFTSDFESTDLTEQTERIDLTEEYSDPTVDTEGEFSPSHLERHIPETTHAEPTLSSTEQTATQIHTEQTPTSPEPTHIEPAFPESTHSESIPADTPTLTPSEQTPAEPTPIEPTPTEPTPIEPTPTEPTEQTLAEPTEQTPAEQTPTEPTLAEPTPAQPIPGESTPEVSAPETTLLKEPEATSNKLTEIPAETPFEPTNSELSLEPNHTESSNSHSTEPSPPTSSKSDHAEPVQTPLNGKQTADALPTANGYSNNVHNEEHPHPEATAKHLPISDSVYGNGSDPRDHNPLLDSPIQHQHDSDQEVHPLSHSDPVDETTLEPIPLTPPLLPNGAIPNH